LCKFNFINEKINACGRDSKLLFKTVAGLTGKTEYNPMPEGVSDNQLANDFATFFYSKVDTIRKDLEGHSLFTPPVVDVPHFTSFTELDLDTVCKLIRNAKPATCDSDPMPSSLLKQHCDIVAPAIYKIVNTSLSTGRFATRWKKAIVKPLLKKSNLELVKKNYRPVSNLPFLSKIVEKASLLSFTHHIETHSLLPIYQSAYRVGYSTETLLLKVYNDILFNMERQFLTPLVAIDLSAAFDTVNHDLLLEIMQHCFGVCDTAKDWISSYLSDRSFEVCINGESSTSININFSVPQGSINGPVYFTCYSSTLGSCVDDNNGLIGYADDHSVYGSFKAGELSAERYALFQLSSTLDDIKEWMLMNRLKMNEEKTEFIVFGHNRSLSKCNTTSIRVGESDIPRNPCLKLLGVYMDEQLNFKRHIATKCRAAMCALMCLKKLRPHLSKETSLKLANALIFSHMDYGNGLFINLPKSTLHPFQRIQNYTAKVILQRSKFSSSTEALKELHILPIHVRSEFKLLVLTFKCIHGLAPKYLSDLLNATRSRYTTRSSSRNILHVPFVKCKTFAERSFSIAAPKLWNNLPGSVQESETVDLFKKRLKTHLFERTFK
jgi:hypothetical protein